MNRLKNTVAAGAVILSATGAFADSADNTNPYTYIPEEFSDMLNSLPPELAMNIYNHSREYTHCIESGGAIDAGSTTLNVMDIIVTHSINQLKNFIDFPDQFDPMSVPFFEGAVVCASQSEAWGLLQGGRLADALCDETGNRILNFSRPLEKKIGLSAKDAAPTCNNL